MTVTGGHSDEGVFVRAQESDPRLQGLVGPGGPFEIEDVMIDGVPLRWFVRAPATIVDVFQAAKTHASLDHLVFEEVRLTFADVRQQALSAAGQLKSAFGVVPGDRVAIAMRNFPEFVVSYWAAAALGAIAVPLNSWWTGPELRQALEDAGAKVVFADAERIQRLASAAEGHPAVPAVGVRTAGTGVTGDADFDELVSGDPLDEADLAALGPDDAVTILYTSGTTGRPKGALLTNRNIIVSSMNMALDLARDFLLTGRAGLAGQPATMAAAPLFHIGGIGSMVGGAMSGLKIALMSKWNLEEALALAEREQVTSLGGVPAIARQLLDHPGVTRLTGRVRSFPMGGASVPPDLPRQALDVFGDSLQIFNGYGLTETTSAVVTNVGAEYAAHPDSVGRPNLTADLRIEDPDGKPLPAGAIGELCFRSPQIAKGYWNNPEATLRAFVGGWFHTGDLGYVDDDGFVYVVDRLKDVIIRGGENVYCAEVEAVLFEHPAVAEVAVVGLAERAMGERVCAVVIPRTGFNLQLAELRAFAEKKLAAFKCPEALYLTMDVPRTATGKTAKRQLKIQMSNDSGQIQSLW